MKLLRRPVERDRPPIPDVAGAEYSYAQVMEVMRSLELSSCASRAKLVDMETRSVRRVLAVKPDGPWLVLINGTTWNVESRNAGVDTSFAVSRLALLPLLERPRDEVERLAEQALGPDGPDIAEALQAAIQCGLSGPSEYWISRALAWVINDEVGLFAGLLREIAVGRSRSQATQHAAKRLLKQNGHWPTTWRPPHS
ncbi:hypothetical protein [Nonomuraea sp. B19D2]|uniref:hypothetical protein n=1 Tax=Nonomuraea sp. B19D2 TaxID=3159561 RepID=UPI0032DB7624